MSKAAKCSCSCSIKQLGDLGRTLLAGCCLKNFLKIQKNKKTKKNVWIIVWIFAVICSMQHAARKHSVKLPLVYASATKRFFFIFFFFFYCCIFACYCQTAIMIEISINSMLLLTSVNWSVKLNPSAAFRREIK